MLIKCKSQYATKSKFKCVLLLCYFTVFGLALGLSCMQWKQKNTIKIQTLTFRERLNDWQIPFTNIAGSESGKQTKSKTHGQSSTRKHTGSVGEWNKMAENCGGSPAYIELGAELTRHRWRRLGKQEMGGWRATDRGGRGVDNLERITRWDTGTTETMDKTQENTPTTGLRS